MPVRSVCVCKSSWLVGREISKAVFHLSPEIPAARFWSEPGVLSCRYLGFICASCTLLRPVFIILWESRVVYHRVTPD